MANSNPYINDERPNPPSPSQPVPWALIALAVAVAGLFLPSSDGCSMPLPVPPFVEPVVDPAESKDGWIVLVEETEERTPAVAKVVNSPLWRELEARGLNYRHYDIDSTEGKVYANVVSELGGVPVVIAMTKDGKVLGKSKLPATSIELNAFIKESTGR